eukprot:gene9985-3814_t
MTVRVYERTRSLRDGGAGIGIEFTSLACLEALGFGGVLSRAAALPMGVQIHRTSGKELFRSELPYVSCYWNDVYRMLHDALPEGTLRMGRNVTRFVDHSDGTVGLRFDAGGEGGAAEERCDLLVGCDGPTST